MQEEKLPYLRTELVALTCQAMVRVSHSEKSCLLNVFGHYECSYHVDVDSSAVSSDHVCLVGHKESLVFHKV